MILESSVLTENLILGTSDINIDIALQKDTVAKPPSSIVNTFQPSWLHWLRDPAAQRVVSALLEQYELPGL